MSSYQTALQNETYIPGADESAPGAFRAERTDNQLVDLVEDVEQRYGLRRILPAKRRVERQLLVEPALRVDDGTRAKELHRGTSARVQRGELRLHARRVLFPRDVDVEDFRHHGRD